MEKRSSSTLTVAETATCGLCLTEGGVPRQLTLKRAPTWSPDGQWIVFNENNENTVGFSRIPVEEGNAVRLSEQVAPITGGVARFSPDSGRLFLSDLADGTDNIWEIVADTGATRPDTNLEGRPGGLQQLGLATDGRSIYFAWSEDISDIWVADIVDP